jgi:hypothetical protein
MRGLCKLALRRGAQWRYLVLFMVVMLLPVGLAFAPIASFLGSLFDHSPRAADLVARLDSAAFTEVLRQLGEPAAEGIFPGTHAAVVVAAILAPLLAGAAAALARQGARRTRVRDLLGGAGELYPRMLRMALVALLPLGLAAGGAALAFHLAGKSSERAVLESVADRASHMAMAVSVLLLWLAHVTVEAGRAHLAAQPERRSALLAWWSGVRLTVRRPGKVLGLCLLTTVCGVGGALLVTALRYRLVQAGPGTIVLALLLSQLAVVAIAWGRSSRLAGLVELVREGVKVPAAPAITPAKAVSPAE